MKCSAFWAPDTRSLHVWPARGPELCGLPSSLGPAAHGRTPSLRPLRPHTLAWHSGRSGSFKGLLQAALPSPTECTVLSAHPPQSGVCVHMHVVCRTVARSPASLGPSTSVDSPLACFGGLALFLQPKLLEGGFPWGSRHFWVPQTSGGKWDRGPLLPWPLGKEHRPWLLAWSSLLTSQAPHAQAPALGEA